MAKPNITTRATKGSALTWTEGDANLENLRDATVTIKAGTGGTDVVSDLNGTVTLVAGTNVTLTGDNSAKTITIDAAGGSSGISLTDLSATGGVQYNNTTGEFKLTTNGLPTINTGTVTSIDGDTDYIYVASAATLMMSYQISFTGAGLMGTNIMSMMSYWITEVDYGNSRIKISETMGGPAKDVNTATGLTDVTYQVGGAGGGSTYKLAYSSSTQTFNWMTETTTTPSLTSLTDVSIMPPVTNGYVLTYNSSLGKWQAGAPAGGGISNVVEDTTPQLGGTLDANGNEIDMGTNTITDTKVGNWDTAYSWGDHSTAGYQTSLGFTPENSANKGAANGYASLDANSLVPSTQLPSYVDDVLEYTNQASFPTTGETGKIYVAADTSRSYRWTGTVYSEIIASPGTTDNVTEGSTNLYFKTDRARSSLSAGTGISYDSATGVITSTVTSGVTITDDTSTDATRYIVFEDATSGSSSSLNVSSSKLTYNPSTGTISANRFVGILGNSTTKNSAYVSSLTVSGLNNSGKLLIDGTALSSIAWTTSGIGIKSPSTTYTDTSSSGTVGSNYVHSFQFPLLASTNAVTITNAATIGIYPPSAGTNTTITNAWSIYSVGKIRATDFSGTIGATTPAAGTFTTLTANAQGELRLADSDSTNYVGFKAPATVSANKVWILPAADGTANQVLKTDGAGNLGWATAGGGGASFALATAQSSLYTDGTNKNIMWTENYDSASCLTVNATTGQFTLTAGSYIVSLEGMGRIGSQGNGLEFYNVTGSSQIRDMGYSLAWDGGTTFMIPIGSFYLTPATSTTYVFRFTGSPTSTSITSTVLNLMIRKVA